MSTPRPAQSPAPRSRLHLIYYALAGFDIVTVLLSFYLISRVMGMYANSVEENAVWAERLAEYSRLSQFAAEVNAPGNDAFEMPDQVDRQEGRLQNALARFQAKVVDVQAELDEWASPEMSERFAEVTLVMDGMTAEAARVFEQLRVGRADLAGEHMAAMDRKNVEVNRLLATMADEARQQQQRTSVAQARQAESLHKYELIILALIVMMVFAVTLYGHRLTRRLREAGRQTEHYVSRLAKSEASLEQAVVDRTAELHKSYEQLELAERMVSIGTLAAGLGHDMNNVLFPVRCRLQTLNDADVTDEVREEVNAINKSVDYLLQLGEGLRLLALDPGSDSAAGGRTSINAWWADVEPLFRTAIPKGRRLESTLPEQLPDVPVAPHRLTQAVFNLLVNAGEAMSEGGRASLRAERGNDVVRISVTDDGYGMTEEVRQQALHPFFTTKKRGLSTGLGLTLVQGVATAAGGRVDIQSAEGEGTTVTIELPALPDQDRAATNGRRSAVVSISDRRQATFIGALLRSSGFEVCEGSDAETPDADVWVVEAGAEAGARTFVASSPERRLIWMGDAPNIDGAIVIDPARGVGGVREAIKATLSES